MIAMEIFIILLLILLNGVFAMSEVALISARKSNLRIRAAQGSKSARRALELAEDPDKFLSTVQIGITLIGILTGIFSGAAFAAQLGSVIAGWGVSVGTANAVAQIVIVAVVTYVTIVFGELVPKRIGMNAAERVAIVVAQPMYYLSRAASPFVWLLSRSIELACTALRLSDGESRVTEEEIKSIIQEGAEAGEVQEVEQRIVGRVFSLGDRTVESVMTHRNDLVWLSSNMSAKQIRQCVAEEPHSIYPVCEDSLDRLLGVVYLKDLVSQLNNEELTLQPIVRKPKYFHEQTEVYNALEQLREEHQRYGIVCDEFGVTQGIITLQDILDALVGDIPDEHEQPCIVDREDGSALIDGQCPYFEFLEHFDLEDIVDHSEFNTISGLILTLLGHIPNVGERLEWNGFEIEIVDMDRVRIDRVLVKRLPQATA